MIFLNITNSYDTKAHTGIQRVVKQFIARLTLKPTYKPLVINDKDFFLLNEAEIKSFLEARDLKLSTRF